MSIRILFFAALADIAGRPEAALEPSENLTAGSLFADLCTRFPGLASYRASALCAVNSEYARADSPVRDGDEVAFFPPVSGG